MPSGAARVYTLEKARAGRLAGELVHYGRAGVPRAARFPRRPRLWRAFSATGGQGPASEVHSVGRREEGYAALRERLLPMGLKTGAPVILSALLLCCARAFSKDHVSTRGFRIRLFWPESG